MNLKFSVLAVAQMLWELSRLRVELLNWETASFTMLPVQAKFESVSSLYRERCRVFSEPHHTNTTFADGISSSMKQGIYWTRRYQGLC